MTYKNGSNADCLGKINITDSSYINFFDKYGQLIGKGIYTNQKEKVFITFYSALFSPFYKKNIDFADVFYTNKGICEMHTLIKKNNRYFIYSINKIIDDSTIVGKEVNFNLFKKSFDSPDSYIEFMGRMKEPIPLFISNDFQRFYYHNCNFRVQEFYVFNNADTSRQATFDENTEGVSGFLLLDIGKLRGDFPNYRYY